jgi:large subunit ribosomal protein L50
VFSYISETDTMFGGISAFPASSTIVTGIRYKKKYKGHDARTPWTKYF